MYKTIDKNGHLCETLYTVFFNICFVIFLHVIVFIYL